MQIAEEVTNEVLTGLSRLGEDEQRDTVQGMLEAIVRHARMTGHAGEVAVALEGFARGLRYTLN